MLGLQTVALADDPTATEIASQAGFIERKADGATVGTGLGFAGALPGIENLLHGGRFQRGTVANGGTAGGGD